MFIPTENEMRSEMVPNFIPSQEDYIEFSRPARNGHQSRADPGHGRGGV